MEKNQILNEIDELISSYRTINKENAGELIRFLSRYESVWECGGPNLYGRIILVMSEAYRLSCSTDKAICFLERHLEKFEQLYPNIKKRKSQMYFFLGKYYAEKMDRKKTYQAFKNHIKYLLASEVSNVGFSYYSYRSCNMYTLADLKNNTLTLASPKTFNDPLDCLVFPWLEYRKDRADSDSTKLVVETLIKLYSHLKVRCFIRSEPLMEYDNDEPRLKSYVKEPYEPLMWAHYASSHTGFCVKYKFNDTMKIINSAKSVSYSELRFGDIKYVKNIDIADESNVNKFFFIKSKEWEYEHEVRLLHYDPTWKGDYKPIKLPLGCVKEIYFGLKCSEENKQAIREALAGQSVKFFQIETQPHDFYKLTSREV